MTRCREGNAHGILVGMAVCRSGRIKVSFIYRNVRPLSHEINVYTK
jgi:hypothetical protein